MKTQRNHDSPRVANEMDASIAAPAGPLIRITSLPVQEQRWYRASQRQALLACIVAAIETSVLATHHTG